MERIGIYSGTFDPPHVGHFRGAQYACEALELDRLLMIPDFVMPHKQQNCGCATAEQRLQMVRLGLPAGGKVEASDLALRREDTSYTYETIAQIRIAYPDAKLFLLMGSDMLPNFPRWLNAESILRDATLAVFRRGGKGEKEALEQAKERVEAMDGRVILLENPITDISST